MATITTDGIRAAAERLIHEATLHHVEYGSDDLTADILLVGPAALAGLDMQAALAQVAAERDAALERVDHWIRSGIEYAETAQTMVTSLEAERDAARREVERLAAALEEVRGYALNVAVCAEAYNETESAHLWQEAANIADAALYSPVEIPT